MASKSLIRSLARNRRRVRIEDSVMATKKSSKAKVRRRIRHREMGLDIRRDKLVGRRCRYEWGKGKVATA